MFDFFVSVSLGFQHSVRESFFVGVRAQRALERLFARHL